MNNQLKRAIRLIELSVDTDTLLRLDSELRAIESSTLSSAEKRGKVKLLAAIGSRLRKLKQSTLPVGFNINALNPWAVFGVGFATAILILFALEQIVWMTY